MRDARTQPRALAPERASTKAPSRGPDLWGEDQTIKTSRTSQSEYSKVAKPNAAEIHDMIKRW